MNHIGLASLPVNSVIPRAGLPCLLFHRESSISDGWRAWCDFSALGTRGCFLYPSLVGRDIGDTLSSHLRWYVVSLGKYLKLGDDPNFISGVSCPCILGAKILANKRSRKVAGVSFPGAPVTKKRQSSMAAPRGSANLSLSFSGSLVGSLVDPPDAAEWNNSDLRALMDSSEEIIGASVLSKGGGLPLAPPGDEADVDVMR